VGIPDNELIKRQDALPIWQFAGSTYHVEFTCRPHELSDQEKEIVRAVILNGESRFFDLILGCIMPDHVHLLIRPNEERPGQTYDLGRIMKGIKGTSGREINRVRGRAGMFWKEESYNRIIRNSAEFKETFHYIANNPVVDGLCSAPEDYPFMILARPDLRW